MITIMIQNVHICMKQIARFLWYKTEQLGYIVMAFCSCALGCCCQCK